MAFNSIAPLLNITLENRMEVVAAVIHFKAMAAEYVSVERRRERIQSEFKLMATCVQEGRRKKVHLVFSTEFCCRKNCGISRRFSTPSLPAFLLLYNFSPFSFYVSILQKGRVGPNADGALLRSRHLSFP